MQRTGTIRFLFIASCILVTTLALYWPGLTGSFLFDDLPNLSPLGRWTEQDILTRGLLFLLSGESGPTGRPVALLSFFFNDTVWPSSAFAFKLTNVLIHLCNGGLVFWLVTRLLTHFSLARVQILIIAATTSLLWLIHPLQVSTVLYVIQRMTELSAFFTLAALISWLYGRDGIARQDKKITWMTTAGIGGFGLLAILSKENAALIPLYILTLEILFIAHSRHHTPALKRWLLIFTGAPSLLLIVYLIYTGINSGWQFRSFSLGERLLSEANVLIHYLSQIVLPNITGMGIFHEDFPVSHGLLEPIQTIASITLIILLLLIAWFSRKQIPILSFAIAWFFAGHLIESTVLPLELYFEHRNYLPLLGIQLALVWGAVSFISRFKTPVLILLASYSLWLGILTATLTNLWGQPLVSAVIWADQNPGSVRAQLSARSAVKIYANKNSVAGERYYLKRMLKIDPELPAIQIEWQSFLCAHGELEPGQPDKLVPILNTHRLTAFDLERLQKFSMHLLDSGCLGRQGETQVLKILAAAQRNPFIQNAAALHVIHYTYGLVYAKLGNLDRTMHHLDLSYEHDAKLDIRLQQVIHLYTAGLYSDALEILNNLIKENSPWAHKLRQTDIDKLRALVLQAQRQASDNRQENSHSDERINRY